MWNFYCCNNKHAVLQRDTDLFPVLRRDTDTLLL